MALDIARLVTSPALSLSRSGGIMMTMNSLNQGGANRVGVLLANGFANEGIPTCLVLMKDGGDAEVELKSMLNSDVSVVSAGKSMGFSISRKRPALGHQHLERLRGVRTIARGIRTFRPGVVLAVSDDMAFTTALARPIGGSGPSFAMKLTSTLFRPGGRNLRNAARLRLFDFFARRYDCVLTLAEAERRQLSGFYPSKAESFSTVPNPYVTSNMLRPGRAQPRAAGRRIITAGRFVKSKRLDVMLRAFAQAEDKTATLTLLGDGPLRGALSELAHSLQIADRVRMPGYVEDIAPWLHQSDLFLLTSDYEGLPAVLIEALACGVPVVTTDSFLAARELLGDALSCAVVPKSDLQALVSAIDGCLRRREAGADYLRQIAMPYKVEASVSAHIEILAKLVAKTTRTASGAYAIGFLKH